MSLLDYLLGRNKKKSSSSIAKERLQIIISHERSKRDNDDYLIKLQDEILAVLAKYVHVEKDKVCVNLERIGDNSVLELNITMPEVYLVSKE